MINVILGYAVFTMTGVRLWRTLATVTGTTVSDYRADQLFSRWLMMYAPTVPLQLLVSPIERRIIFTYVNITGG